MRGSAHPLLARKHCSCHSAVSSAFSGSRSTLSRHCRLADICYQWFLPRICPFTRGCGAVRWANALVH